MALSKKQLEQFRIRLEDLKAQLNRDLAGTAKEVKSPDDARGASQHHADEGTDDFARIINIEVSCTETDILKQIDRALEKIAEGTYGECDISGEQIPIKRLEAIPYATMTVEAQQHLEKGTL